MKVKLLTIYETEYTDIDDHKSYYMPKETTDWDDITTEELKLLREWVSQQNSEPKTWNDPEKTTKYVLIAESDISIPLTIKYCLKEAKVKMEEKVIIEQERIRKEATIEKNKKAKEAAKEKALLERLKNKYEGAK